MKPIGSSKGDTFGHVPQLLRVYLQENEKPLAWSRNRDCAAVQPGQACVFSKKVNDQQWLWEFLGTAPDDIGELRVVCGIHEPEDDPLTPRQYKSMVRQDAYVVRDQGHIPIQVLMNARDGKWVDYASPAVAEMWWDPYHGGVATVPKRYNPPAVFLKPLIDASASKGKPWGLAEVGSLATAADTDQTGRCNWIVDLREYVLQHPQSRGASWFNKGGNTMTKPMADAWFAGRRP